MNIKDIIKEEIDGFDFLNHESLSSEKENVQALTNLEFQKQFIIDSLNNPEKINLSSTKVAVSGDWEDSSSTDLDVEYITNVEYKINDEKITKFKLSFIGENMSYDQAINYDETDKWFNNVDLSSIDVSMYDLYGKKLKFQAYDAAPEKIKYLFKRKYVGDLFK